MKLTPLDIHHKEFTRAIRGYNEAEVDEFLDRVADELERLFKENIDLKERLDAADERLKGYQDMERTLHNTLLSAQKSAEDIVAGAHRESEVVLRDAEVKAKEIIHGALQQKQKSQGELVRITQAEQDFRGQFKALLEKHLSGLVPVPLPGDIQVLTGEAAGETIAEVEVTPAPVSSEEIFGAAAIPELEPLPIEDAPVAEEPTAQEPAAAEAQVAPVAVEPEAVPTAVESVQLGEVTSPELPEEQPELEVREFTAGYFQFGERDDDLDIEEID